MTRKRSSGGRTTPKGTTAPKKKAARPQPGRGGPPQPHDNRVAKKRDKSRSFVARPETHNRGNR